MKLVPAQERAAMLLFEFGGKIPGASVASLKQTSPSLPAHLLLRVNACMYLGKRGGTSLELQRHVQQSISVPGMTAWSKAILRCKVKAA